MFELYGWSYQETAENLFRQGFLCTYLQIEIQKGFKALVDEEAEELDKIHETSKTLWGKLQDTPGALDLDENVIAIAHTLKFTDYYLQFISNN